MIAPPIATHALLSLDSRYRYKLSRTLRPGGRTALWIGVNPSTADAELDDASIRRLYGFAEQMDVGRWLVGNLFAYRATNVKELAVSDVDPIGPDCDLHLGEMMAEADIVIAGWGRADKVPPKLRNRWRYIVDLASVFSRSPLLCWGLCSDGHPVHPLMIPYTSKLRAWEVPK